jgi:hypothetical protein
MNPALLLAASCEWTQILIPGHTVLSAFGLNGKGQIAVSLDDGSINGVYGHDSFKPLPPFRACHVGNECLARYQRHAHHSALMGDQ